MDKFNFDDRPSHTAFPVAVTGRPMILASAFVTLIFALLGLTVLCLLFLGLTFFMTWFFRDPDRVIPTKENAVVSPADGTVVIAGLVDQHPFASGTYQKISIFMSIFNVHVNRVPHEGSIEKIIYRPGKYFAANLDKASTDNEQNAVCLKTQQGESIWFVQIAGLVARRIICQVGEGQTVIRGQRFGMICLGSRLDVYLPKSSRVEVKVGDKVKAGTTMIGHLR